MLSLQVMEFGEDHQHYKEVCIIIYLDVKDTVQVSLNETSVAQLVCYTLGG
jgi:hypothetical protein